MALCVGLIEQLIVSNCCQPGHFRFQAFIDLLDRLFCPMNFWRWLQEVVNPDVNARSIR